MCTEGAVTNEGRLREATGDVLESLVAPGRRRERAVAAAAAAAVTNEGRLREASGSPRQMRSEGAVPNEGRLREVA